MFRIPRYLTSAAALVLLAAGAQAQMSGTYTIDPRGSGSRNFPDFANATYQLFILGVSGPVTIEVVPGTYNKSWSIAPIPGVSAKNTVTFKSKTALGAKLGAENRESTTLVLGDYTPNFPVSWIVIDGFEFTNTNSGRTQYGVFASGTTSNIEIRNCRFPSTRLEVHPGGDNHASGWRIHHNTVEVASGEYGLYLHGGEAFEVYNNDIRCNLSRHAIYKTASREITRTRSRIYNNVVSGLIDSNWSGIRVDQNTDVDHNTVVLDAQNTRASYGIHVTGLLGRHNAFRNNIIVNFSKGPALYVQGALKSFEWFANGNIYHAPSSETGVIYQLLNSSATNQYTSLASWQQASGQDSDSMFTDPKLVGGSTVPDKFKPQNGSPGVGAAKNTSSWITTDFAGIKRPTPASIGAFEIEPVATFVPFGQGCAGTFNNVPKIGHTGELKLGSSDFAVTLANALGNAKTVFAVGLSKTRIGSVNLPLAFGGGCNLLTSSDVVLQLMTGGSGPGNGTASVKFKIPSNPKLKGVMVHFQWAVVDSAAKGIGLAFSDGATVTL